MAKTPQWMLQSPTVVAHPASTLQSAARVIRQDAKGYRAQRNADAARAAERIASALDAVSRGATWAAAFELPIETPSTNTPGETA